MRLVSKLFVASLLLTLAPVGSALAGTNAWTAVASLPTTLGNSGASAGPCTGAMSARCVYSIGGLNESTNATATVNMYNPATNAWSSAGALNTARTAFGTTLGPCVGTLKQNCIYAIGGADIGAVYLATVEMYNAKTNKWSLEPNVPTPGAPPTFLGRAQLAATRGPCFNQLSQTCVYAIGGYNPALYQLSSVEMFNPATTTWTAATSLVTSRSRLSAASGPCQGTLTATCLYAIGGTGNSGFLSSVEMYNPATNSWSTVASLHTASAPPTSLGVAGTAAAAAPCRTQPSRTCIYAYGGQDQHFNILNATMMYDPQGNAWTYAANMITTRDNFGGSAGPCPAQVTKTCLFALGGSGATYTSLSEDYRPGGG